MLDQTGPVVLRLGTLRRSARFYLAHTALRTAGLAIAGLFFNLAILTLGYSRGFLGLLNTVSVLTGAALSLPLWWLVGRIGLGAGLLLGTLLQAASVLLYGLWPAPWPLLVAVGLGGAAAVLTEVSSAPLMMRYSDAASRDYLFSASAAITISVAGLSTLVAGMLPGLFAGLLDITPGSAAAYRATFLVAGAGVMMAILPLVHIVQERAGLEQRVESREPRAEDPGLRDEQVRSPARPSAPAPPRLRPPALPPAVRELLSRPWPLLRLLLTPFLISWGAALLIPYLNVFFRERYSTSDQTLGLIFAGLGVITGLASLLAPLISKRIGKPATVALTQGLSIPFLLALGFVPLLGVAVAAALIRAALFNMARPLYNAFVMEQTDEPLRPTVNGLLSAASTAGYLLAPSISTYTQERYGFAPLFVATTCCYVLAALLNLVLFVRRRP